MHHWSELFGSNVIRQRTSKHLGIELGIKIRLRFADAFYTVQEQHLGSFLTKHYLGLPLWKEQC